MAKLCAGMSGREISKLGVAWQAAVYSSENGVLTEQMVLEKCTLAVQQHKQKVHLINSDLLKSILGVYLILIPNFIVPFQMAWLSEQEKSDHKSITGGKST